MRNYALVMDITGKPVVVVGGGSVAYRKVKSLLECGAAVTVISPELVPGLRVLVEPERVQWNPETFSAEHLNRDYKPVLVFGTTNRREVNMETFRAATQLGIPCNIADVPDLCTFTVPAVVSRGDLMIAVSTGGASPALARRIREDLEARFGPEYAILTKIMGGLRRQILTLGRSSDENKDLFLRIVDSEILEALKNNDLDGAVSCLRALLPPGIDPEPLVKEAFTDGTGTFGEL